MDTAQNRARMPGVGIRILLPRLHQFWRPQRDNFEDATPAPTRTFKLGHITEDGQYRHYLTRISVQKRHSRERGERSPTLVCGADASVGV